MFVIAALSEDAIHKANPVSYSIVSGEHTKRLDIPPAAARKLSDAGFFRELYKEIGVFLQSGDYMFLDARKCAKAEAAAKRTMASCTDEKTKEVCGEIRSLAEEAVKSRTGMAIRI